MQDVTIITDDGTQLSAQLEFLPHEGDYLFINVNGPIGGNEVRYLVKQVAIHLAGPMVLHLASITVSVAKA